MKYEGSKPIYGSETFQNKKNFILKNFIWKNDFVISFDLKKVFGFLNFLFFILIGGNYMITFSFPK
jgi:hypothetical protein